MAKFQLFSWPIGLSQLGLQSIIGWDFTSVVVHREKWEGLAWGPDLAYGRSTLVIVSDDNFSLVQRNLVGLLAARRSPRCRSLSEN
jgi:hypothetical protein